jgi:hypothetical protein
MSTSPSYEEIAKWTIAELDLKVLPARRRDEPDALLRISVVIDRKIFNVEKIWRNGKTRLEEKVGGLLTREEYLQCVAPGSAREAA